MKVRYDREANATYIYLRGPISRGQAKTQQVLDNKTTIIIDQDEKGTILGIELLGYGEPKIEFT